MKEIWDDAPVRERSFDSEERKRIVHLLKLISYTHSQVVHNKYITYILINK